MEAAEPIFKFPFCAGAVKCSLQQRSVLSALECKHDGLMRNECAFFWVLKKKSSFYTESKPKANKQVNLIFCPFFLKKKN